jgi:hypothetical protein
MTTTERETRERTYGWDDPIGIAAAAQDVDGLTFLRRLASGEVAPAPIAATLGFTVVEVEEGRVVFGFEPAEYHFNPAGPPFVLVTALLGAVGPQPVRETSFLVERRGHETGRRLTCAVLC